MILQSRDQRLLELLSRYGVLSTKQIADLIFLDIAHSTVMRRLRKLSAKNLIHRCDGLPNAMSAWSITRNAARLISRPEPMRFTNRNTITHEVELSQLRLSLECMGLGEHWTSEMELRRMRGVQNGGSRQDQGVIPDGIFLARKNSSSIVVAVELELSPKGHSRYRKLFEEYRDMSSIRYVWYVLGSVSIAKPIVSQWEKILRWESSPRLIVSHFDEIYSHRKSAQIQNIEVGTTATIRKFFELEPALPTAQALSREVA